VTNLTGITDLHTLLKSMKPELVKEKFVFCTVSEQSFSKLNVKPLLIFKEEEGITIVLKKESADANSLPYSSVWALITLTVSSDLTAVGFLAAITNSLAESGISVNVVSAYYHDHLFVPIEKAEKAMQVLKVLSNQNI